MPEKTTSIYSIQGIANGIAAINQTNELLNELLGHGQNAPNNQKNLHLLTERYNLEKSRLSKFTQWYGEMPRYKRYAGAVLIVSASALVGAVFNLAAVFSILAIGIHYIATSIIMEDYAITSRRDERFCEDIIKMEEKLAASIDVLAGIASTVNNILIELREKNNQSAKSSELFEGKISSFNDQINSLLGIIKELEGTKDVLIHENETIKAQFQNACVELEKASLENTSQSVALSAITSKLGETNNALFSKNHELTTICEQFQLNLIALAKQKSDFETQIQLLKSRTAEDEQIHTAPSESEKETMDLKMNTDRILAESDELLAKIKRQEENRPLHQNQPGESSTSAVLAYAQAQLAALERRKSSPNFTPA